MSEIVAQEAIYNILNNFLTDKPIHIKEVLASSDELFKIYLYYKKYNSAIALPVAKFIVNKQNTVYKIAALLRYGIPDVRKLSKEEKQRLEIPFEIRSGSTGTLADILKQVKEIIAMIPEKSRTPALIASLLCVFSYFAYSDIYKYIEHMDNTTKIEAELKNTELEAQTRQKEIELNAQFRERVVDKLSQANDQLAGIIKEHDRSDLNKLEAIDGELSYQGKNYTPGVIRSYKKVYLSKYKRTEQGVVAKTLKGEYRVVSINMEKKFINIKNGDDVEKVYYPEDLIAEIEGFKQQFKRAIDEDGGKVFYIEAGYIEKDGKKEGMMLQKIRPET